MKPSTEISPQLQARLSGACWLMCVLTSIYALIVSGRLIVRRDAAATAANLLALLGEFLETGKIRPFIERIYKLSEVPEALRLYDQGHARGKIVIAID
ncbi:MAG: zinc-binding dehydrogenase [Chthoniobacterales bacterium]|nr:zinc-binding dehydrogenase [Chthoniobacterales bacterium]